MKDSEYGQLKKLESTLKNKVDNDFFQDPKSFQPLTRVIDVLGSQLLDSSNEETADQYNIPSHQYHKTTFDNLHKNNPAYTALRNQQDVVERAIEHLSIHHCSDLNSSVVAVGKASKKFDEAVGQVKGLRRQVQAIRENLASHASIVNTSGDLHHPSNGDIAKEDRVVSYTLAGNHVGGNSLRELWLKKLECEAVLSLIQKLEIVRRTPRAFDILIHSRPCRIGASVVLLSDALNTMFQDDVAQIQALHKIMEHLMTRKQKAEEILWETLQDVLFLRTGNGFIEQSKNSGNLGGNSVEKKKDTSSVVTGGSGNDNTSSSKRRGRHYPQRKHRFVSVSSHKKSNFNKSSTGQDSGGSESDTDDDEESTSIFSDDFSSRGNIVDKKEMRKPSSAQRQSSTSNISVLDASGVFANFHGHAGRLLPRAMLDSELNLEVDELCCLAKWNNNAFNSHLPFNSSINDGHVSLPRYTDPVLALRILIEALAKLGRLDDVERCVSENIEREVRRIAQLQQAKTLSALEKFRTRSSVQSHRRPSTSHTMGVEDGEEKMKEFKSHLRALLKGFGSVMLRLSHLAQILRHRITSDPKLVTPSYPTPSSALHSVLVTAQVTMQREIKGFIYGCLDQAKTPSSSFQKNRMVTPLVVPSIMDSSISNRGARAMTAGAGVEQGIFSLGIISDASLASSVREKYAQNLSSASRSNAMRMSAQEFVMLVLCPRTGNVPQVRHALFFRRNIAAWTQECDDLKKELAFVAKEDTSTPVYNATTEETALAFLDDIVKNNLLPTLQDAAVNGTVTALENAEAFEPILRSGMYNSPLKSQDRKVEMCLACQGLYSSTGPLFSALNRLPRGGEMFLPLVANLEHSMLTFISRVKQRVLHLCEGKKAFELLENSKHPTQLSSDFEFRKAFSLLWNGYFDNDNYSIGPRVDSPTDARTSLKFGSGPINPLSPSVSDTKSKKKSAVDDDRNQQRSVTVDLSGGGVDQHREQETFEKEVLQLLPLLNFFDPSYGNDFNLCTEDEFLKAGSLAHSLLTVASLLDNRLKPKKSSWKKSLPVPRALRECIKNIRIHGLRVAKFCRMEILLQTVKRMCLIFKSDSLTSKDTVRLPNPVNEVGEYLTSISDLLREYSGNKITAYSLSNLEQYVPLFLMETVRIVAMGESLPDNFKITLNGVEALDRSCSVLYRDLKGATTFENSSWDDNVAADAFERAASYVALMELDMEELVSYCRTNRNEYCDEDYKMMFGMNGPRRKGDVSRYAILKDKFE